MQRMLAAIALIILSGCNLGEGISFVDGNNQKIIAACERIAPLLPQDSVAAPVIKEIYWRSAERIAPWTVELRRATGNVSVDVPRNMSDHKRIVSEDQALAALAKSNEVPFGLSFLTEGWGGTGTIATLVGTALSVVGIGGGRKLLKRVLGSRDKVIASQDSELQKATRVNNALHFACNQGKTDAENDPIKLALKGNAEAKESYQKFKLDRTREQMGTDAVLRRHGVRV